MATKPFSRKLKAQRYGRWGEFLCRITLNLAGWRIIAQGYVSKSRSGAGEIDLIAHRASVIAFIEVKARQDIDAGLSAVSKEQQRRIIRGAERFIAANPHLAHKEMRFDVMIVRPWRWPMRLINAWQA
jgi:putative endonuclease